MTTDVGKRGIPAMAYPAIYTSSPMSLFLVIKHNHRSAQATLCLSSPVFLQGLEDAQPFILQYDANNLVPGTISLGPTAINLPQTCLTEIARSTTPQICTLSLSLSSCCPVWCPSSASIEPKAGCEAMFHQLAALAKATRLCIVFDYNYLRTENRTLIQQLIAHPEQLSGFPLRYRQGQFRCADASIFEVPEGVNTDVETDAAVKDEPPPPYVEAGSKRPRDVPTSPSSSSSSPIRKRVLFSPPVPYPISPTEKDSTAPPSFQPPCSSPTLTPNLQDAVHAAVSKLLPSVLEALLPTLFTTPSSPSSPMSSQTSNPSPPPPPSLSALGTMLSEHAARRLELKIENICDNMLAHASYQRDTADTEFLEALEDKRLDLIMAKEDCVAELDRVVTDKLHMFREDCTAEEQEVGDRLEQTAITVCDNGKEKMDALISTERDFLRRERGWLNWERKVFERDKGEFESAKENAKSGGLERSARAGSAPA
ncbi:hypothetical protein CC86DRAFT_157593 [Ophiobolus disseminans]|uniref:Uncharacterized protein n=1 Tax=Ophiobolus disseminans TaxID=1469910 RepID=A0A6A6ZDT4_9PLEO|nr:hypothetical protein CC86DRAFT_157593 [Ophiobolus disseminans]